MAARKIEVEMKYEVARPGSADRYLVAPELGPFTPDGQVRSIRVEDRYVDSTDWALARAGFAARLRKTSRGTEISLKATNVSPGRLHRREEIEGPADEALVPGGWPASQARNVVMEHGGTIEIESRLGKGTIAIVDLPLAGVPETVGRAAS